MNFVTMNRIIELTEKKPRFSLLKKLISDWKLMAITSVAILTVKTAAEQIWMAIR